jgi:hypothetical protein
MSQVRSVTYVSGPDRSCLARSEGFEPPTLGIEIRCSIQLSYERVEGRLAEFEGASQQGLAPFVAVLARRRKSGEV